MPWVQPKSKNTTVSKTGRYFGGHLDQPLPFLAEETERSGASTPPVWGSLYYCIPVQLYLSQTFMHFFDQLCDCSVPRFIQHGCWSSIIQSLHGLPRRSFQQPALHLKKPTVNPAVIQLRDL